MQVFFIVLTKMEVMPKILKKMSEHDFKGTVMHSESIRHALLHSNVEPAPIFGSLNKIIDYEHTEKPTIFVVLKDEEEVELLKKVVNESIGGIKGKGFMFSVPALFIEGLED